jgi:hypothetical protein
MNELEAGYLMFELNLIFVKFKIEFGTPQKVVSKAIPENTSLLSDLVKELHDKPLAKAKNKIGEIAS